MRGVKLKTSYAEEHISLRTHLGDHLYLLANGDLGVVYELQGLYDHPETEEGVRGYFKKIYFAVRTMTSIPSHENNKNLVYQFLCSQREEAKKEIFSPKSAPHDLLKEEENFYRSKELTVRTLYLCLRYETPKKTQGLFEKMRKRRGDPIESLREEVEVFQNELKNFEEKIGLKLKRVGYQKLTKFLQEMLKGEAPQYIIPNEANIHESIMTEKMTMKKDHILSGKNTISLYYVPNLPMEGQKLGDLSRFLGELPGKNWDMVVNWSHLDRSYSSALHSQEFLFRKNQEVSTHYKSFRENVGFNHPHLKQSIRLITYNEAPNTESKIQHKAQETLGWALMKETDILGHMLMTSLPLNLYGPDHLLIGRTKSIRLQNALSNLPLFSTERPLGPYKKVSSFHSLVSFDLFAGEGNNMTAVLGRSRAGKGVTMSLFYLEFLSRFPEGVLRIIDKKTSSRKLVDLMGGKLLRLSEDQLKITPLSPFSIPDWGDKDISAIKVILFTVIIQKNKNCEINSIHDDLLGLALKMAYNSFKKSKMNTPHLVWEDITLSFSFASSQLIENGLKKEDVHQANEDLNKWTLSFKKSGQYGFLFSALETKGESSTHEKIIVYDLDGISDPILKQVTFMMTFQRIERELSTLPLTTKKMIVFEEMGMLLKVDNPEVEKLINIFMSDVVKTCAKLNAQGVGITNDVHDYTAKAGVTFWDNATQKIFLPLGPSMCDAAQKVWGNQFNEAEWQILRYLHKNRPEKYSTVYIQSHNEERPFRGLIKIYLSPFMDALTTTSAGPTKRYDDYIKEGLTAKEALDAMVKEHPYA